MTSLSPTGRTSIAELVSAVSNHTPPLDRVGFHASLDWVDAALSEIPARPSKRDLRQALHAICRARVNARFAELRLRTRF